MAGIEDCPGCVVSEIHLPGPNGLEVQRFLRSHPRPLPIIFLTRLDDVQSAVQAMKAGAMDFLTKPVDRRILLASIQLVLARSEENCGAYQAARNWQLCYESLTNRQQEVFELVVAGKPNKEIAAELGTAERTIKLHRAEVMKKMQATSVASLVQIALQLRTQSPLRP